jgi:type I restriction enzyme, R subunit
MRCSRARKMLGEHDLKIATIFSYVANEDDADANGFIPEEISVAAEPEIAYATNPHTREKLDEFIGHYNQMFGSAFSTRGQPEFL